MQKAAETGMKAPAKVFPEADKRVHEWQNKWGKICSDSLISHFDLSNVFSFVAFLQHPLALITDVAHKESLLTGLRDCLRIYFLVFIKNTSMQKRSQWQCWHFYLVLNQSFWLRNFICLSYGDTVREKTLGVVISEQWMCVEIFMAFGFVEIFQRTNFMPAHIYFTFKEFGLNFLTETFWWPHRWPKYTVCWWQASSNFSGTQIKTL